MKPLILLIAVLTGDAARAQSLVVSTEPGAPARPLSSDAAVFELQEPRTDLACSVSSFKPELGFDFLFHGGYRVNIPMKELVAAGDMLTIVLRVRSERRQEAPVYLSQRFRVPAIGEDTGGSAVLDGFFELGEGRYHVDWLMRDRNDRVCARFWNVEARATGRDASMDPELARDLIQPAESTPFHEDPTMERQQFGSPLSVKIIINFGSWKDGVAALKSGDLERLASILRKMGREPRIGDFSVVACSVQAQQVLYRQHKEPRIDLPALGRALESLNLASVDAKVLAVKNGETEFLGRLIAKEAMDDQMDALIFVSPKYPVDANVSREIVEHLRDLDRPVFYLNYNLSPVSNPWSDQIGRLVKQLHGFQYTISQPLDLFNAWSDIVSRLLNGRQTAALAGR
jgi:hypothetical protein